jgi:hypothetical protein
MLLSVFNATISHVTLPHTENRLDCDTANIFSRMQQGVKTHRRLCPQNRLRAHMRRTRSAFYMAGQGYLRYFFTEKKNYMISCLSSGYELGWLIKPECSQAVS